MGLSICTTDNLNCIFLFSYNFYYKNNNKNYLFKKENI